MKDGTYLYGLWVQGGAPGNCMQNQDEGIEHSCSHKEQCKHTGSLPRASTAGVPRCLSPPSSLSNGSCKHGGAAPLNSLKRQLLRVSGMFQRHTNLFTCRAFTFWSASGGATTRLQPTRLPVTKAAGWHECPGQVTSSIFYLNFCHKKVWLCACALISMFRLQNLRLNSEMHIRVSIRNSSTCAYIIARPVISSTCKYSI